MPCNMHDVRDVICKIGKVLFQRQHSSCQNDVDEFMSAKGMKEFENYQLLSLQATILCYIIYSRNEVQLLCFHECELVH